MSGGHAPKESHDKECHPKKCDTNFRGCNSGPKELRGASFARQLPVLRRRIEMNSRRGRSTTCAVRERPERTSHLTSFVRVSRFWVDAAVSTIHRPRDERVRCW